MAHDGKELSNAKGESKSGIPKSKVISYLLLTAFFVGTSFLSLYFIYTIFSDKTSFLSFDFLTYGVLGQLIILMLVYFLCDTLRFYFILKTLKISVSIPYMIKLAFINMFISNITPFATGGGFAQIYFLNKKGVSVGDATAGSSIRTLLPIIFFFITTPIILIYNRSLNTLIPVQHSFIYIFVLAIFYGALGYLFYKLINNLRIFKIGIYKTLKGLEKKNIITQNRKKRWMKRLYQEAEQFSNSFNMFLKGSKLYMSLSILFTLLFLLSLFSFPIILVNGMGYNISPFTIIALQIVITFITYFAPTPGATGIAEGGFSIIFAGLVKKSDIVSLTFAWRFFSIYVGVLIGLGIFYIEIIKNFIQKKKKRD